MSDLRGLLGLAAILAGLLFYLRAIQWVVEIVGGAIAWFIDATGPAAPSTAGGSL